MVETLDHAVLLRVVVGGPEAVDAKESHNALDTRLHESTSHRVSGNVRHWSGFRPFGEAVHTGKQVLVIPGEWQGAHNVYVDVLESPSAGIPLAGAA